MERHIRYNEYRNERDDYNLAIECLVAAVEVGDLNEMTDGAVYMLREFEKLEQIARSRNVDEHDAEAARMRHRLSKRIVRKFTSMQKGLRRR